VEVRKATDETNLSRGRGWRERFACRVRRSLIETDHRWCIDRAIAIDRAITDRTSLARMPELAIGTAPDQRDEDDESKT